MSYIEKLVSVIIPTYKRSDFLQRAINSVLSQNYENLEILVVDDNTDNDCYRKATEAVMHSFSSNPKVFYFKHHTNMNGSAARNTGLSKCKGDYIVFLDDDDFFLPNRLRVAVEFLERSSNNIGGCCVNYIKKYKNFVYKRSSYDCISSDGFELLSGLVDYGAGSTLMIKREVLNTVKGFDVTYIRHQDWEFLLRVFRHYKLVCLPHLGVVISADGIRNTPNVDVLISMKKKLFREFSIDLSEFGSNQLEQIYNSQTSEIINKCLKARQYSLAGKAFLALNKHIGGLSLFLALPKFTLSFVLGFCPSFMILVYWFCNYKYSRLHKVYNL